MAIIDQIKIIPRKRIVDSRGLFLKPLTGLEEGIGSAVGEVYITTAKPGNIRGNHYHIKASEWFTLIQGEALLYLENIDTKEKIGIIVKAEDANTYYVPPKLAHVFINPHGTKSDFMLIAYSDAIYNPKDTVTYIVEGI